MHNERKPLSLNAKIFENETVYYTVKSILGYGGTGVTYKCISSFDGNYYCLKELYPTELADCLVRQGDGSIIFNTMFENEELLKTWNWYKENLINESKKQQVSSVDKKLEVNDPYFLKSYGTFTSTDGNLYARYDIQKGSALSQIINELSLSEIISVLITACKKLESLHNNKGLLHLDLSPANLYVTDVIEHARGKEAYFLDFGNAKEINESDDNHRYSATEGYSAQEVLARTEGNNSSVYKVGPYSDTYSLVAILFKALTGEIYSAEHRIDPALWENKVHSKLEECGAKIAADSLINILRKGLSEQQKRYQSADQLINDLYDVNKLITGNNTEINILIRDIEVRITSFENSLKVIDKKVSIEGKKTRKFIGILAACFTVIVLIAFAIINFYDFKPPTVQLIGVKTNDDGYIEIGTSIEMCFQFIDDSGIKYQDVSENDIILDGVECEKHFEKNNGFYKLTLMNIRPTSDMPKISIKEGCAEDYSKNKNIETIYLFSFTNTTTDRTVPTLGITHPVSKDGNDYIKAGSDIVLSLWLSDNNNVAIENVVPEYIQTVGFTYQDMIITGSNGEYSITIKNIQGTTGKYHIYFAPGIAIDDENNYSFGVKSRDFYLYNNSDEIDKTDPVMTISAPKIYDNIVEYRVAVNDNIGVSSFYLTKDHITPIGFSADIKVEYVSTSSAKDSVRIIRFTNIKSTSNSNKKYFIINSGVATDNFDNQTKAKISSSFSIPE